MDNYHRAHITDFPPGDVGTKGTLREFSGSWCRHIERVRKTVAQNPSQTLVEIGIDDPSKSQRLSDMFDIDQ